MIILKDVDRDNFWDIINLSVYENQRDYLTSNAVSIAQSKVQPECTPLAIYNNNKPIGFTMYCLDKDDGEYWIYKFMIDKRYQSKGFGKTAFQLLLERIRQDRGHNKVFLGVHKESIAAIKLYKSFGFEFNGKICGKEHIMQLSY